jgi:hypothetical protein
LKPISPIEWCYEFTTVENIWGKPEDPLVYRATLLLLDAKEYLGYSIRTCPYPYNTTGLSVKVKLHQEWALDTTKGEIFVPTRCRGMNPVVCRAGAQYGPQRKLCTRGIITGERIHREECEVELRSGSTATYVEELQLSQYVIVTWGETIREYCTGKIIETTELSRGVYFIEVQFGCTVTGIGCSLAGHLQGMERFP